MTYLFHRSAAGRKDFGERLVHQYRRTETRCNIARLDPTTGLADSFNPNANERIYSITVQADGKILVGGVFTSIGGDSQPYCPARCHRSARFVRPERER